MKNKLLTALLGFFVAILIITFSIGLTIYFRPFYYMQIDALDIEAYSGAAVIGGTVSAAKKLTGEE